MVELKDLVLDENMNVGTISVDNIEITASAKPSTIKATSPLQILTIKEIETTGITSVADAVRRFTGVTVKDYGGIGGLKTVSLRGFGAQHTVVAYDGITLNDAQAGMIDISRFSLNNVSPEKRRLFFAL